ncbi:hypothetical protein BDW42DRAFT_2763 [Aspergillus taichungensis]|uniref:Uncharacterized protein n=1 Tax=Aspergillus taichungensis TaxID=482145 RepID=A0A2J5I5V7_9EURO|nr:hypothetical protein BDW42DRAFT_2763 [Aspergillus taichungensis]
MEGKGSSHDVIIWRLCGTGQIDEPRVFPFSFFSLCCLAKPFSRAPYQRGLKWHGHSTVSTLALRLPTPPQMDGINQPGYITNPTLQRPRPSLAVSDRGEKSPRPCQTHGRTFVSARRDLSFPLQFLSFPFPFPTARRHILRSVSRGVGQEPRMTGGCTS